MTRDVWQPLVAEAGLAPSVHNVQPARWRVEGEALVLCEFTGVRLAAADPEGRDAAMSLGAAYEGLKLAASRRNLALTFTPLEGSNENGISSVARIVQAGRCEVDPLTDHVAKRQSWRGNFRPPVPEDLDRAGQLASGDCHVFKLASEKHQISKWLAEASLHFMRDKGFRRELVDWMRLSKRNPNWARDGLNADAMRLNRLEALCVPLVLGGGFDLLDRLGLARKLVSEAEQVGNSAAIAVFHRPVDESPFVSGRHFYRLWLRFTAAGFSAAVLAALADDKRSSTELHRLAGLGGKTQILSAFRIGVPDQPAAYPRARLPLGETLL